VNERALDHLERATPRRGDVVRIGLMLLLVTCGLHAFTASLPVAMAQVGIPVAAIGLVLGAGVAVQIPAALVVAFLIGRIGPRAVFVLGTVAYECAALLLVFGGTRELAIMGAARLLQGIGAAWCLPGALALASSISGRGGASVNLSFVNGAVNLAILTYPFASLVVMADVGLTGIAVATLVIVGAGLVGSIALPDGPSRDVRSRPSGRSSLMSSHMIWILLIVALTVVSFGAVSVYLPPVADQAGVNAGLFFTADGILILLVRVPVGMVVERHSRVGATAAGLVMCALAVAILLAPISSATLILSGSCYGLGAALVLTPALATLGAPSMGSAAGFSLSLYAAAMAAGQLAGILAPAGLTSLGFFGALALSVAALLGAGGVLVTAGRAVAADQSLAR
jgi:MFS family permease